METPGFGLRIAISILVVFGWAIFLIVWFLFYAGSFSVYQNFAAILASILIGIAVLASAWVSWGVKYGYKYGKEWDKKKGAGFKCTVKDNMQRGGGGGAFYFLGFLGALIYYLTTAPTLAEGIIGILKALVWPAFLVFGALKALGL